jgi:hypothetical protein
VGEARVAPPAGCIAIDREQRLPLERPVVERSASGAAALGARYWEEVERCGRGLLRCRQSGAGVEVRLLGRVVLLAFGPPEVAVDAASVTCTYPITGGRLVRCAGGAITLGEAGGDRLELSSAIAGYVPRLAAGPGRRAWTGLLYHVERRVHEAVGRRYFARMVRRAQA